MSPDKRPLLAESEPSKPNGDAMERLSRIINLATDLGQLALVVALLMIARELWHLFAWTGAAR